MERIHKLFTNLKPPAGFEFKGFYDYTDGTGGTAIAEATIFEKAIAWRDSVR